MRNFLLWVCFIIGAMNAQLRSQALIGPPMQGHTTATSMQVWVGVKGAETVRATLAHPQQPNQTLEWHRPQKATRWRDYEVMTFPFERLAPGTEYGLFVELDGKNWPEKFTVRTFGTAIQDSFSFLLGSCAYQGYGLAKTPETKNGTTIFQAMGRQPHEFMLWLGDNNYYVQGEWDSRKKLMRKCLKDRMDENLSPFLGSGVHYAITDDHDFGPNNCDGTYKAKDVSTQFFREAWPNPYAREDKKGNYFRFRFQDIAFFMLDDRYFRINDSTQIFGEEQMAWLRQGLRQSDASFHFVCMGSQALNEENPHETWFKYSSEREPFFQFLREEKIPGVLFLTGDRHFTELQRLTGILPYPLYDLTCSPMTSWVRTKTAHDDEAENEGRVPGTLVLEQNFGKITVSGPVGERVCRIDILSVQGKPLWTFSVRQQDLQFPD